MDNKEGSDGLPQNPNPTRGSTKGRSYKGCLYYSFVQKSKSKYPTCVGFYKTLNQVPSYIVGETELEASKVDRSLTDFKYGCVGYSVFLDRKDSNDPHNRQAEFSFCVGLEVLYDKRPTGHAHSPAPARKSEVHDSQLVDDIPIEKLLVHDVLVDIICTPTQKLAQIKILRELKRRIERETGQKLPSGPSEKLPPTARRGPNLVGGKRK